MGDELDRPPGQFANNYEKGSHEHSLVNSSLCLLFRICRLPATSPLINFLCPSCSTFWSFQCPEFCQPPCKNRISREVESKQTKKSILREKMRYNLSNVCRIIQLERSGWDKVYSHVSSVLSLCFSLSFSLSFSRWGCFMQSWMSQHQLWKPDWLCLCCQCVIPECWDYRCEPPLQPLVASRLLSGILHLL